MSAWVSLAMDVLDQQLVDADGRPIGRVDDLELVVLGDGGPPRVRWILTGAQALGERLGGSLGRGAAAVAGRLREGEPGPARIAVEHVKSTGSLVHLDVPLGDLPGVAPLERWLAHHLIARLPGTGDAGQ
jgi:hypothetical protein